MAVKLTPAQTLGFVTFLYDQVSSTAAQPIPVIEWLAVPPLTLQNRWEALGIGLDDIPADSIDNSLTGLIYLLDQFDKRLPNLTRRSHNELAAFLEHGDRVEKSTRIGEHYPNEEGDDGAVDIWQSFVKCLECMQTGAKYLQQRREDAILWLAQYDEVSSQLSQVKALLPRVKIGASRHADLLAAARVLVSKQDTFWESYKAFVQTRVDDELGEDGLAQCVSQLLGALSNKTTCYSWTKLPPQEVAW